MTYLTLRGLEKLRACRAARDRFHALFGERAAVTLANAEKFLGVGSEYYNYQWGTWLITRLLEKVDKTTAQRFRRRAGRCCLGFGGVSFDGRRTKALCQLLKAAKGV